MRKLVVFFILSFSITTVFMLTAQKMRGANRKDLLSSQAQVIGGNVEDKFGDYFNHIAYSAIQLNKLRALGVLNKSNIQALYDDFLAQHTSVLGVNKINDKGIIDDVYPFEANRGALGKKTQTLSELIHLREDQNLWLSAPFNLYQGMKGFGFYVRTENKRNEWLAIVITSEAFFKKFIFAELGENFHIQFKETNTGNSYLQTAEIAITVPASTIQERNFHFYNRDFKIIIWPKSSHFNTDYPWLWPTLLSLLIALISTLAYWWWTQNAETKSRLEELNQLLRLTIHDTSNSLTAIRGYLEMMKDDPEIVPIDKLSKHVSFIVDLLDQIKIMKQLSSNQQEWKMSEHSLLQLVLEVSDILSDRLKDKKLSLSYDPEELVNVKLSVNKSLFSHSVLGNLLSNAIKFSFEHNTITIHHHLENDFHVIEISDQGEGISQNEIQKLNKGTPLTSKPGTLGEAGTGFGLMIVKQVLELHHGKIEFNNNLRGGTIARIFLPLAQA